MLEPGGSSKGGDASNETGATPVRSVHWSWDTTAVAALAILPSAFWSNRPLLGGDELTTVSIATRPIPALWTALQYADMHQGLYYLLMHIWFTVFPVTEFWARLPSAIAVGLAAAGIVILGKQLSTRSVAVTSGIIFGLLPRVTFAGSDVRVFAASMAVAVWLTVLIVAAARRADQRYWMAYGVSLILGTIFYAHLLLMVPVHAVAVGLVGRSRTTFRSWATATGSALALLVPYFLFARSGFPLWMPKLGASTLADVFQYQYFERYPTAVSIFSAVILAAGLLVALRAGWRRPSVLVALSVTWIVVPTAEMLAVSLLKPLYLPRYLSFTAPAFALLLGLCIVAVARQRVAITLVVLVFALAAWPNYTAQRAEKSRGSRPYRQFTEIIDKNAAAGDCVVFIDDGKQWPPLRRMTYFRPEVFQKLNDPAFVDWKQLHPTVRPFAKYSDKLADCSALWIVSWRDWNWSTPDHQVAADPEGHQPAALPAGNLLEATEEYKKSQELGFKIVERWQLHGAQVTKSVR